jgi:hypothetical protein
MCFLSTIYSLHLIAFISFHRFHFIAFVSSLSIHCFHFIAFISLLSFHRLRFIAFVSSLSMHCFHFIAFISLLTFYHFLTFIKFVSSSRCVLLRGLQCQHDLAASAGGPFWREKSPFKIGEAEDFSTGAIVGRQLLLVVYGLSLN